ncbi:MAG: hypothetical protein HZB91_13085 [Elusimicrobia bacterium]|nr:hypothetical protein [Elusimicrobiota bacterium]
MRSLRDAALLAALALAAWPILSKARELVDLYRSGSNLRCLANLTALASKLDGGSPVCPVTGRPYRVQAAADASVFQCDDPAQHLRVPMRFLRSGSVTQARMTLPDFAAAPGSHELSTTKARTVVEVSEGSVTVHLEKKPWERFFVMPLAALAGFIAFLISAHFAVDSHAETRKELARTPGVVAWLKAACQGIGRLSLWTACMAWAAVLFAFGARGACYTRDITVLREQSRVAFQDRWLGKDWTGPDVVSEVQALVPVAFGKRYFRVYALFPKQGRVDQRFLFTVGEAEAGVVSLLQRPPVFSPR